MTAVSYPTSVHAPIVDKLLTRTFAFDAVFSASWALLFLLAHQPIADFIGLSNPTSLLFLGVFFIFWAGVQAFIARNPTRNLHFTQAILAVDFLWVVGSYGLLLSQALQLNDVGNVALLIQADMVLVIAIAKIVGWRRSRLNM